MKGTTLSVILSFVVCLTSMGQAPVVNDIYIKELDNWQRSMALWKLRNFVPLVGLHLLNEGDNTFGKDPSNDIVALSILQN